MDCAVCGRVDNYDENDQIMHLGSIKHICNTILANYKDNKKFFSKNRNDVNIFGGTEIYDVTGKSLGESPMIDHHKIRVFIKPKQEVKFVFSIRNESHKDSLLIVGIQLAHPQPNFVMNDHPFVFGKDPHVWENKTDIPHEIYVNFHPADIGQYEMPIMFTFHETKSKKNLIIIREMVVMVEENPENHTFRNNPYTNQDLTKAKHRVLSTNNDIYPEKFRVPYLLKIIFSRGIEERALEGVLQPPEVLDQLRRVLYGVRCIFDEGITKSNYMEYFHHLLWWEETITRINLKKYNMTAVKLEYRDKLLVLEVPGLAEKRPSLLRGDRVYLQPQANIDYVFECIVKKIDANNVHLSDVDYSFFEHYSPDALFDVRFIMSRVPMERCHEAVSWVFSSKQMGRLSPEPRRGNVQVRTIKKFYNPLIRDNEEQRSAVENIVAGTSGIAPYIVFGPPGTGKTITIVEAIIQLVVRNPKNRVLVCTDSNMAADHIAVTLLKYNKMLNINNFIIRANSRYREWTVLPAVLEPVSNGTSYENFRSLNNHFVSSYRIVVTTLLHAAKYASARSQSTHKLKMSHLFIDEAAQASEPSTLVPITGLLAPTGQLVLAGDPKQLGPVCLSRDACSRGLGKSLLERLRKTHSDMYENNPNYITMLVKNFRSNPDILKLPNELFYGNELVALAPEDPLSSTSILGLPGGDRAVVFHAIHSREQRMGNAPSYFNEKELDMLKRYVKALTLDHKVLHEDIGIIAPYIRQVYKMKSWLTDNNFEKIEVGTVEAYQGKEKRVILVSTVRANCRLLEYDAKYALGFLVDDRRFNVAITRGKAKVVIIGNPACLTRDIKWRQYMQFCKDCNCYYGLENQQMDRTSDLLNEIARIRFDKCGLTAALKEKQAEKERKKNNKKR